MKLCLKSEPLTSPPGVEAGFFVQMSMQEFSADMGNILSNFGTFMGRNLHILISNFGIFM